MPGRPIIRKQLAVLTKMLPDEEAKALEYLATDGTVRKLAARLGVSLIALYKWRDELPERQTAWANALRFRADYLADEGLEIVDEAEETNEGIGKARMRADYRRWLAGVSNPERYQAKPTAAVTINIGSLHLEAVRLAGQERVRRRQSVAVLGEVQEVNTLEDSGLAEAPHNAIGAQEDEIIQE